MDQPSFKQLAWFLKDVPQWSSLAWACPTVRQSMGQLALSKVRWLQMIATITKLLQLSVYYAQMLNAKCPLKSQTVRHNSWRILFAIIQLLVFWQNSLWTNYVFIFQDTALKRFDLLTHFATNSIELWKKYVNTKCRTCKE